jgi:anti-anti-sigma factor
MRQSQNIQFCKWLYRQNSNAMLCFRQVFVEESQMEMTQKQHNDVLILCPEGKITLGDGDQELGEAVRGALDDGAKKILIDFSKVSYLDSSGVGELVGCYTSIKNKSGELRICGMNSRIFGLMKMTSLHSVFDVKDTEAESLADF